MDLMSFSPRYTMDGNRSVIDLVAKVSVLKGQDMSSYQSDTINKGKPKQMIETMNGHWEKTNEVSVDTESRQGVSLKTGYAKRNDSVKYHFIQKHTIDTNSDQMPNKENMLNHYFAKLRQSEVNDWHNMGMHLRMHANGTALLQKNIRYDKSIYNPYLTGTSRPDTCRGCFMPNFTFIINEPDICNTSTNSLDLLILIASAPENSLARLAIRNTWCAVSKKKNSNVRCVFMIGQSYNTRIRYEHKHYRDIIQTNYHDSYRNLTYKTLAGLKWTSQYCKEAKYIMKTDDDMFVNTFQIPSMLKSAPGKNFFGGFCWEEATPHREADSKWFVSYEMYPSPIFPPMCSGTGYIMSRDIVDAVVMKSADVPFFYLEDVYIAICLDRLGIVLQNLQGFSNMHVDFIPCIYRYYVLTSHWLDPSTLMYDWKLASQCPHQHIESIFLYVPIPLGGH